MKRGIAQLTVLALLLLAGCASSERMARLSGGVMGKYSIPKDHRLRSKSFARVESHAGPRGSRDAIGDLNSDLVNIWPFFFRSNAYTSVLWPFIDVDKYGFAIRPFYNQEGNDCSILFPLSAWNSAAGEGWILNTAWDRSKWMFFPLAYHSFNKKEGLAYYTPFWIRSWDFDRGRGEFANYPTEEFTNFLLFYWGNQQRKELGKYQWLFRADHKYPDSLRREAAYRLGKENRPVPKDEKELRKLRREIWDAAPDYHKGYGGFFPFFYYSKDTQDKVGWNILWLLADYTESKNGREFICGAHLLASGHHWRYEFPWWSGTRSSKYWIFSVLLSGFAHWERYQDSDEIKNLRQLYNWSHNFDYQRKNIADTLKKLPGQPVLPKTVTDGNTLRLFLQDYARDKEFPVRNEYTSSILPLYWYNHEESVGKKLILPCLLSGYRQSKDRTLFWSVPLLSYVSDTPRKKTASIATPMVYFNKVQRYKITDKPIQTANTRWTGDHSVVESDDDYIACGLYYRGRHKFLVAKPGLDGTELEALRQKIIRTSREYKWQSQRQKGLDEQAEHIRKAVLKTKLDKLRHAVRVEELRLEREKQAKEIEQNKVRIKEIRQRAAKLKWQLADDFYTSDEKMNTALQHLVEKFTDIREWEDRGSGFFYRSENYFNGDYKFNVLGGLIADGQKDGASENKHILHLLYRLRKDDKRSEELIFPFIVKRTDGDARQVSFMWRLYERTEKAGKVTGHIFFIPFGK